MDAFDSVERVRQEIHLMVEYVDATPRVELEFLRLHAEMLLGFIRDAEWTATTTRTAA